MWMGTTSDWGFGGEEEVEGDLWVMVGKQLIADLLHHSLIHCSSKCGSRDDEYADADAVRRMNLLRWANDDVVVSQVKVTRPKLD